MSIEIKCDICKRKIEGSLYYTNIKSGCTMSNGYREVTTHRCISCDLAVDTFIKSITKN
jgi:hypothetical protein